jgi:hypothetical protein
MSQEEMVVNLCTSDELEEIDSNEVTLINDEDPVLTSVSESDLLKAKQVIISMVRSLEEYVTELQSMLQSQIKNIFSPSQKGYSGDPHRISFMVTKLVKVYKQKLNLRFDEKIENIKNYARVNLSKNVLLKDCVDISMLDQMDEKLFGGLDQVCFFLRFLRNLRQ